jgi:hypothetical protein
LLRALHNCIDAVLARHVETHEKLS